MIWALHLVVDSLAVSKSGMVTPLIGMMESLPENMDHLEGKEWVITTRHNLIGTQVTMLVPCRNLRSKIMRLGNTVIESCR
jgi:hypothetical protein